MEQEPQTSVLGVRLIIIWALLLCQNATNRLEHPHSRFPSTEPNLSEPMSKHESQISAVCRKLCLIDLLKIEIGRLQKLPPDMFKQTVQHK